MNHASVCQLDELARRDGAAPAVDARAALVETLGGDLASEVVEQVEIGIKYAGYIDKQQQEVARAAYYEHLKLPADLDYNEVGALSIEVRQKLNRHRPETLGQASRLSGITPAAISLLLVHLRKGRWKDLAANDQRAGGPAAGAAGDHAAA